MSKQSRPVSAAEEAGPQVARRRRAQGWRRARPRQMPTVTFPDCGYTQAGGRAGVQATVQRPEGMKGRKSTKMCQRTTGENETAGGVRGLEPSARFNSDVVSEKIEK